MAGLPRDALHAGRRQGARFRTPVAQMHPVLGPQHPRLARRAGHGPRRQHRRDVGAHRAVSHPDQGHGYRTGVHIPGRDRPRPAWPAAGLRQQGGGVTYHLAAFRLCSVGERSARFTDVTLDLTAPDGGGPRPADTVVWLRNGGGKSSLLSLFYALLLPRAIDFMGRAVKRSLTDYVDSGDTAHTLAAWHPATSETLDGSPDRVLITGVVYEWSDLRRPADADRARDRLDTTFYACYAVPGVLELDRL